MLATPCRSVSIDVPAQTFRYVEYMNPHRMRRPASAVSDEANNSAEEEAVMPTTVIYLGDIHGTVVEDINSLTLEQLRKAITHDDDNAVVQDSESGDLTIVNLRCDPVQRREADRPLTIADTDRDYDQLIDEAEAAVVAQCRRQLKELLYITGRTPISLTKVNDIFPSA
jgi:hypothetical protein